MTEKDLRSIPATRGRKYGLSPAGGGTTAQISDLAAVVGVVSINGSLKPARRDKNHGLGHRAWSPAISRLTPSR